MSADQYHTLTVTPFGRDVMAGRVEDVRMLVPAAARKTVTRTALTTISIPIGASLLVNPRLCWREGGAA